MNRLPGIVSSAEVHGSVALVEVAAGGRLFSATLIGSGVDAASWPPGTAVTLMFKETEVALAKNLSGLLSMRNRIPAIVTGVEHGRLLTRVRLQFDGHALESVITTRSAHALQLAAGDSVEGLVKANEMTLLPGGAE